MTLKLQNYLSKSRLNLQHTKK